MYLSVGNAILRRSSLGLVSRTIQNSLNCCKAFNEFPFFATSERIQTPRGTRFKCLAEVDKNAETVQEQQGKSVSAIVGSNGDSASDSVSEECTNDQALAANAYPTEAENDELNFFPVRDPGGFPPVDIEKVVDEQREEKEFDPLRDGPLRYLGYSNELGEAFAAWLPPGGVPLTYAVAVGYVLVDTGDKGFKAAKDAKKELDSIQKLDPKVIKDNLTKLLAGERALDTVVWQLLASVIIPGFTIHSVVAFVQFLLLSGLHINDPDLLLPAISNAFDSIAAATGSDSDTVVGLVQKSVPTFCGLAAIPFIVHPIDSTVHAILNMSMRPTLRKFLCNNGQGRLAGLNICDEECMVNDFPVLDENNTFIEAFSKSFEEEEE